MTRGLCVWVALGLVCACGDDDTGTDAGGSADAGRLDGGGGTSCAVDDDCDDGVYCDGRERCMPSAPGAGDDGCVEGEGNPCLAGQTCDEESDDCAAECGVTRDADGDGSDSTECGGNDCDDNNGARHPGATEVCDVDDVDEDCDVTTFGVRDQDDDDAPDRACCNGDSCGSDCDDTRSGVNPDSPEVCNGRDDDCDSNVDEEVLLTFYVDADMDGYGVETGTMMGCLPVPVGYAELAGDCNDGDGAIHPGVRDICDLSGVDDDCDGTPNNPVGGCSCSYPGMQDCPMSTGACLGAVQECQTDGTWGICSILGTTEVCDPGSVDEDCDGMVNEQLTVACWDDLDGDGYAPDSASLENVCPVAGREAVGGCPSQMTNVAPTGVMADCNDALYGIRPLGTEACGGADEDCDGSTDEDLTVDCYLDSDNDGYALSGSPRRPTCPDNDRVMNGYCPIGLTHRAPAGMSTTDCDDNGAGDGPIRAPGLVEQCDMTDNDCDVDIDEDSQVTCWADPDDDGYAVMGAAMTTDCPVPGRASRGYCPMNKTDRSPAMGIDCAEGNAARNPGAQETCNGVDDNCNMTIDDGAQITCYADADDDGYSMTTTSSMQCASSDPTRSTVGFCPQYYTNRVGSGPNRDCVDNSAAIRPNATEVCDLVDNNCNSMIDEGFSRPTCYHDGDNDTYAPTMHMGAANAGSPRCPDMTRPTVGFCPTLFTNRSPTPEADCNDANAAIRPNATETCDGADANCNPADEYPYSCYQDLDDDGYGAGTATPRCTPCLATESTNDDDCCDGATSFHARVYPGATTGYGGHRPLDCPSAPSYDYNCDGVGTPLLTTVVTTGTEAVCDGDCNPAPGTGGWVGSVPVCGASGDYRYCYWTGQMEDCYAGQSGSYSQLCR